VHKIRKDWQVAPMIDKNGSAVYRPPGAHFLQAYVVEMHFDISHKPLSTEIYRRPKTRRRLCANLRGRNALQHFTKGTLYKNYKKHAVCQMEHPDQAPVFTPTVRTRPCAHTHCLGNESMSFEPHRCKSLLALTENHVCCSSLTLQHLVIVFEFTLLHLPKGSECLTQTS
jgi:hypothetical protein